MGSLSNAAATSATSVQVFNENDKQADLNASEAAADSKTSNTDLALGRWVQCHGDGALDQMKGPSEPVIYQPLPPSLYHPTGHLAKPRYAFTNPNYVDVVIRVTKDTSKEDRQYIKSLKKEASALKAALARAKRHPRRRVKNWVETKIEPYTRMNLSDPFSMLPVLIVTRPNGQVRYLEDCNTYKELL